MEGVGPVGKTVKNLHRDHQGDEGPEFAVPKKRREQHHGR